MIERVGYDDVVERDLYLAPIGSLSDWPDELDALEGDFVLFIVMDASDMDGQTILRFARSALRQGAVYVCVWGPGSERVHDLFDQVRDEREPRVPGSVVMTTWHPDEPLREALSFALFNALPHDAFSSSCRAVLAVVVDGGDWTEEVRRYLADPDALSADVL